MESNLGDGFTDGCLGFFLILSPILSNYITDLILLSAGVKGFIAGLRSPFGIEKINVCSIIF